MSRTSKKGLDYYPMDIDMFSDLKIRKLIKYQGGKAVTVYTLLLCNIYKCGYYMEWDKELPFVCSELTGFEEAYILEVIKTCLTLGLFSKELYDSDKVLTSTGIQRRYARICSLCRRMCDITLYNLLDEKSSKNSGKKTRQKTTRKAARIEDDPINPQTTSSTLEQEIDQMKRDEIWLDQLQVLHSMNIENLKNSLDDFKLQCITDGKDHHLSIQDAKQHFNSWLRIINNKKRKDNDKDRTDRNSQRRGNTLRADETKTYGGSF